MGLFQPLHLPYRKIQENYLNFLTVQWRVTLNHLIKSKVAGPRRRVGREWGESGCTLVRCREVGLHRLVTVMGAERPLLC
jgi:hypothetical protein